VGLFKAGIFNTKAADPKNKPDQIIETIGLKKGQSVADIGSGGGFFSLKFAELVGPDGRVYAIDTNPELLDVIRTSAKEKGLTNLIAILTTDQPDLHENSLDLVFMRNVTHHLPNRASYFRNLKPFLKTAAQIAIIEYKPGRLFSFHGLFRHSVPRKTIIREMEDAGFRLEKDLDFLPEQHFTIYSLRSESIDGGLNSEPASG
jgi:arsenite methyltransferase